MQMYSAKTNELLLLLLFYTTGTQHVEAYFFLKKPINLVAKSLKASRKKVNKETNKTTINETAVQDARLGLKKAEKEFFTQLPPFEQQRVEDVTSLLSEYCNSLMYYHCKSIEQLSTAMAALGKVDSKAARKNVEKELKKERKL